MELLSKSLTSFLTKKQVKAGITVIFLAAILIKNKVFNCIFFGMILKRQYDFCHTIKNRVISHIRDNSIIIHNLKKSIRYGILNLTKCLL